MQQIGDLVRDPRMFMFLDESAVDGRTSSRRYGWARRGFQCVEQLCFVCGIRCSLLPVLTLDGIITFDIFRGSVTSELFVKFLREMVVRVSAQASENN